MHRLLLIFLLPLCLTSCLEDKLELSPSAGEVTPFSAEELSVLQQELTIGNEPFSGTVALPLHLAFSTGLPTDVDQLPADLTKALLGRVLFYDTRLSATGETSCATCHRQELAFGDDLPLSHGIRGGFTKRNSIALGSVPSFSTDISGYGESSSDGNSFQAGSVAFFWDERAATIKDQSTLTIQDEVEMGRDLNELAAELRQRDIYRILTRKAYGTEELTGDRITLALEKFCATITAMDTPFDGLMDALVTNTLEEERDRFSASQLHGMDLFQNNCSQCHGSNFTQPVVATANNGLDTEYRDQGIGALQGAAFNGIFKVPFLRNVALTAPYMHDGRFATLREVVNHYSEGIQAHRNLDFNLTDGLGQPRNMHFSDQEKDDLIAFLEMTTDRTVTVDQRLADPFRR